MQVSSLQASAAETPQMFSKVSSTAFLLPQVASVPPLLTTMCSQAGMALGQSAGNSPFLSYQPSGQPRSQSQLLANPTYFNNPVTFGALPNGHIMMPTNFLHTYQTTPLYSQQGLANLQEPQKQQIQQQMQQQMQQQQQLSSKPNSQQTSPQKHADPEMISSMTEFTSEKSDDDLDGRFDDDLIVGGDEANQGKFIGSDHFRKDSRLNSSGMPLVNTEY